MLFVIILQIGVSAFSISDFINLESFVSSSQRNEMILLAVQETQAGSFRGSLATVSLETRRGTGRVFLDTFPLSQIDTQISTRFAKEIACKYVDADCNSRDFIFTLRSDSGIIGGPSAGAAISVLTVVDLLNLNLNPRVAMTGTINSGGIIGPVSGLIYKIDAAVSNGLEKVLVPYGSLIEDSDLGVVYTPSDYGAMVGIEVVEVSDLNEAVYEFTGVLIFDYDIDIEIPDIYSDTMAVVSEDICNRTNLLFQIMIDQFEISDFSERGRNIAESLQDGAIELIARAESAKEFGYNYAAASFCYGANINLRNVMLIQQGLTGDALSDSIENAADKVDELEEIIMSLELNTISDFEVFMIMKERIEAAKTFVRDAATSFRSQDIYSTYRHLSQGIERLYTAEVWKNFMGLSGRQFSINEDVLRKSCIDKLSEAQERIQYINLFVPDQSLLEIRRDFESAFRDYNSGEYALCISKASRAKSSVNVLMSLIMVGEDNLERLIERKFSAVRRVIIQQQEKNVFPIMAFSYYEYARSLKNTDKISALVYLENALELSWLDIYFDSKGNNLSSLRLNPVYAILLMIGFVAGLIFVVSLIPKKSRIVKRKKRQVRRRRVRK